MAARKTRISPGRNDVAVHILEYTKQELQSAPREHWSHFIMLGQMSNEAVMLHGLLAQAINAARIARITNAARPVQETSMGQAFLLARLLAGKLSEARDKLNDPTYSGLFNGLCESLDRRSENRTFRKDAIAARASLNTYFQAEKPLLKLVRHGLAFHFNKALMDEAVESLPEELALGDFHTSIRGTTFFGTADTVASMVVAKLAGENEIIKGADRLMSDVTSALGFFGDYMHAYNVLFSLAFFGTERLARSRTVIVKGAPSIETHRLHFYLSTPKKSRRDAPRAWKAESVARGESRKELPCEE